MPGWWAVGTIPSHPSMPPSCSSQPRIRPQCRPHPTRLLRSRGCKMCASRGSIQCTRIRLKQLSFVFQKMKNERKPKQEQKRAETGKGKIRIIC